MLEQELKYVRANKETLVKSYEGQYMIIIGQQVVDAHPTKTKAYEAARQRYGGVPYLIQLCSPDPSAWSVHFHPLAERGAAINTVISERDKLHHATEALKVLSGY